MHRGGNLGDRLIIELTISPISGPGAGPQREPVSASASLPTAASAFSTRLVALLDRASGCRERRPAGRDSKHYLSSFGPIEFELELGIDHIQEGFEIGASRLDIQAVAIADSTDAFRNCSVISMPKPNDFGARNDDQVREVGDDSDQVGEQISRPAAPLQDRPP